MTNPKVVTATNPGETGEGLARPKHDTRGEALMMTAISTIASVLLPTSEQAPSVVKASIL